MLTCSTYKPSISCLEYVQNMKELANRFFTFTPRKEHLQKFSKQKQTYHF